MIIFFTTFQVQKLLSSILSQENSFCQIKPVNPVEESLETILTLIKTGEFKINEEKNLLFVNGIFQSAQDEMISERKEEISELYSDLIDDPFDYHKLSLISILNRHQKIMKNQENFIKFQEKYFLESLKFATKENKIFLIKYLETLRKSRESSKKFVKNLDLKEFFKIACSDMSCAEILIEFCLEMDVTVEDLLNIIAKIKYHDGQILMGIVFKVIWKNEVNLI